MAPWLGYLWVNYGHSGVARVKTNNAPKGADDQGLEMAVSPTGRLGILFSACVFMTACDDAELGTLFSGEEKPAETTASPRTQGSVRVVEAPEIFDVADEGLWDGRPSLGLIWVAYEGADPTNAIIRNEENGKFVVGALYRRERFFPGPAFQLSSDAAAELGILAGDPTNIRVIALREEVVEPIAVEDPEADGEPQPEEDLASAVEPAQDALPQPKASDVSAVIDPIAAAAAAIEAADPDITIEEATEAAIEEAAPAIPARRPTTEGPNAPLPRRVETPTITSPDTTAEVAIPVTPVPVAVSDPIENPISPPKPGVSTLAQPFIQVGIFSVKENAENTAQMLADDGIIPFIEEQKVGGRKFFRVVVGPASDAQERATLLAKVKAAGFEDAYFVKN